MTSTVGHPIRLHPETIACSNFEEAKIFVKVDITKTLPKEIEFTWGGKEFTAAFYYPWLPSRCNLCEKWGHTDKVCGGLRKREKKVEERDKREEAQKDKDMEGTGGLVEKSITLVDVVSQQEVSVESEGKTTTADRVVPGSVEKIGNDWALVSPDKVGRAQAKTPLKDPGEIQISASKFSVLSVDDEEEGEITEAQEEDSEGVETVSISEEDRMEDEILNQKIKEKEKTAMQKGGRRGQRTKAQEVQPMSKRSSRRNL